MGDQLEIHSGAAVRDSRTEKTIGRLRRLLTMVETAFVLLVLPTACGSSGSTNFTATTLTDWLTE